MRKYAILFIVFICGVFIGIYKDFLIDEISIMIGDDKQNIKFDPTLANEHYDDRVALFKIRNPKTSIVMLGDSITEGGDFRQLSGQDNIINRGIGWDTSLGLIKRLDLLGSDTKKCFILIGINDISRDISVDSIFENYKIVVQNLRLKNIKPIIQSTLYTVDRDEFNNSKVEQLNKKLKAYAKDNNVTYIDLNSVLAENKKLKKEYTFDDVHLNTSGYMAWMSAIKDYLD